MILEGILTVLVGFLCPFILPNDPATAKFLSHEEKMFLIRGLENDSGSTGRVETSEKFNKRYLIAALTDVKIYISVLIYWGTAISNYGYEQAHNCHASSG